MSFGKIALVGCRYHSHQYIYSFSLAKIFKEWSSKAVFHVFLCVKEKKTKTAFDNLLFLK
jgi:hypothetical protein